MTSLDDRAAGTVHGDSGSSRLPVASGLATIALALFLPALLYDLNLPDEPRVAHMAHEMARTGEWTLGRVNGELFLHTPPLAYWAIAGVEKVVGHGPERALRVVSVAAAIGTILVTFALVARYASLLAGLVSACVLASTFQFADVAHRLTVDMTLTLFTHAALAGLMVLRLESHPRWWWGLALGAAGAGAFLTKGIVGPAFLGVFFAALVALDYRVWWSRRALVLAIAAATAVALSVPWLLALHRLDPAYPKAVLFGHVIERAVGAAHHNPSNWQFTHRFLLHVMPWTPIALFAIGSTLRGAWGRRRAPRDQAPRPDARATLATLAALFATLSFLLLLVSRGKRNLYFLPAVPALATCSALWIDRHLDARWMRRALGVVLAGSVLAGVVGAVLTFFTEAGRDSWLVPLALIAIFYWPLRSWRSRRRRPHATVERPEGFVVASLLALVLAVAAWGSAYHILRNDRYTATPFGREVVKRVATAGGGVVGFQLYEREQAAVAWALGETFPHTDVESELATWLADETVANAAARVIVADAEAYSSLRTGVLSDWRIDLEAKLRRRRILILVHRDSTSSARGATDPHRTEESGDAEDENHEGLHPSR